MLTNVLSMLADGELENMQPLKSNRIKSLDEINNENIQLEKSNINLLNEKNYLTEQLSNLEKLYTLMTHSKGCLEDTSNHILEQRDFSLNPSDKNTSCGSENSQFKEANEITGVNDNHKLLEENIGDCHISHCHVISVENHQDSYFTSSSEDLTSESEKPLPSSQTAPVINAYNLYEQDLWLKFKESAIDSEKQLSSSQNIKIIHFDTARKIPVLQYHQKLADPAKVQQTEIDNLFFTNRTAWCKNTLADKAIFVGNSRHDDHTSILLKQHQAKRHRQSGGTDGYPALLKIHNPDQDLLDYLSSPGSEDLYSPDKYMVSPESEDLYSPDKHLVSPGSEGLYSPDKHQVSPGSEGLYSPDKHFYPYSFNSLQNYDFSPGNGLDVNTISPDGRHDLDYSYSSEEVFSCNENQINSSPNVHLSDSYDHPCNHEAWVVTKYTRELENNLLLLLEKTTNEEPISQKYTLDDVEEFISEKCPDITTEYPSEHSNRQSSDVHGRLLAKRPLGSETQRDTNICYNLIPKKIVKKQCAYLTEVNDTMLKGVATKYTQDERLTTVIDIKEESQATVTDIKEESQATVTDIKEESQATVTDIKEESQATVTDIKEESQTTVTDIKKESQATVTDIKEESQATVTDINEESQATLTDIKEKSQATVTDIKEESQTTVIDIKEKSQATVTTKKEESQTTVTDIKEESQTTVIDIKEKSQATVTDIKEESQTTVIDIKEESRATIIDIKEESQVAVIDIKEESQTTVIDIKEESQATVTDIKEESQATVTYIKAESQATVTDIKEESQATVTDIKEESQTTVIDIKERSPATVTDIKEKSQATVTDIKEESQTTVIDIKERSPATVTDIKEESQATVTDIKEESQATVTDIKEESQATETDIKEESQATVIDIKEESQATLTATKEESQATVIDIKKESQTTVTATKEESHDAIIAAKENGVIKISDLVEKGLTNANHTIMTTCNNLLEESITPINNTVDDNLDEVNKSWDRTRLEITLLSQDIEEMHIEEDSCDGEFSRRTEYDSGDYLPIEKPMGN